MKTIQSNFCRLTGITNMEYQTALFETGCMYVENILIDRILENEITLMLQLPEYWKWFQNQFNLKTKEAFGVVGINENEKRISIEESDALFESFLEFHELRAFKRIYPNKLVFNAFNRNIYENRSKNYDRKRADRKSTGAIRRNRKIKVDHL